MDFFGLPAENFASFRRLVDRSLAAAWPSGPGALAGVGLGALHRSLSDLSCSPRR